MLDEIAQDRHVLLAVSGNPVFLTCPPPGDGLQAVAAFGGAERFLGELVELHAVPELPVQLFQHVKRALAKDINWRVLAKNLEVETVAVKRYDAREAFEFRDETRGVVLEPAAEALIFVPRYSHGQPKGRHVLPATLDFVGKPQRFYVKIDFAIEQSSRWILLSRDKSILRGR